MVLYRFFKNKNLNGGYTIVEMATVIVIFIFLGLTVSQIYFLIVSRIIAYREQSTISALANQYLESAKNIDYSTVGTLDGNPGGSLPSQTSTPAIIITVNNINYQVYYSVKSVDDPADDIAPADTSPNDYKQVEVFLKNTRTNFINSFVTDIAPPALENNLTSGSLLIKVLDAVGQPVSEANIRIRNSVVSPAIDVTKFSDSDGAWTGSGLPASSGYNIEVTKSGYSKDQTYPVTVPNPNPIKPDATVANGQKTQVVFSIDLLSSLKFKTVDQSCSRLPGINVGLGGSKLIGTFPDVFKFNNNYTSNASGEIVPPSPEWDSYTPSITSSSYMVYAFSPAETIFTPPNVTQSVDLILGPKTANSLLVRVDDAVTKLPIGGAKVRIQGGVIDISQNTSDGIVLQKDWSGGPGPQTFSNDGRFRTSDGNIDYSVPGQLTLKKSGSSYVSSGNLTSSSFDTKEIGTKYHFLEWQPASQDPSTQVKFQIASNEDNNPNEFQFVGPDGTVGSYYTASGNSVFSGNFEKYIRYKVFLSTADPSKTPVLTRVNIAYSHYNDGCNGPGQTMFSGLPAGSYQLTISQSGYATQVISGFNISGYSVSKILLNPN